MPNADDCRTDSTMIIKIIERGTMSTPALLEFNKASAFQGAIIKAFNIFQIYQKSCFKKCNINSVFEMMWPLFFNLFFKRNFDNDHVMVHRLLVSGSSPTHQWARNQWTQDRPGSPPGYEPAPPTGTSTVLSPTRTEGLTETDHIGDTPGAYSSDDHKGMCCWPYRTSPIKGYSSKIGKCNWPT